MLNSTESFTEDDYKKMSATVPCLVQQGDRDRSCSIESAHILGQNGFKKIIYPDNDHDLFREECSERMLKDMIDFIQSSTNKEATIERNQEQKEENQEFTE